MNKVNTSVVNFEDDIEGDDKLSSSLGCTLFLGFAIFIVILIIGFFSKFLNGKIL
jgi:hypothetical protein